MNENFYMKVLSSIDHGVYFVDTKRKISFWNKGAELITGFLANEVVGSHCYDNILNHVDEEGHHLCLGGCPLHKTIEDGKERTANVFLHHKKGHRIPVKIQTIQLKNDSQVVIGAVELFTDQRKEIEFQESMEKYKELALIDQLTQIPNRRHFDNFMESKYNDFHNLNIDLGLLFFDIDHFKSFNDNYGHDLGDEILKMLGITLVGSIRSGDLAARFGGEEFVVALLAIDKNDLSKIGNKIRILIENSKLRKDNQEYNITVSMGGSMLTDTDSIDSFVKRCDNLMYQSKKNGRNQLTIG